MIARTWIGGENNQASNPNDWSPTGVPQKGDTLGLNVPTFTPLTINVSANDLAGDTFVIFGIGSEPPVTANLSHNAVMNVRIDYRGNTTTFNLSQNSRLKLQTVYGSPATVNLSGSDTLILNGSGAPQINLSSGARWTGTFDTVSLGMRSGADSVFNNNGASYTRSGGAIGHGPVAMTADVTGTGSFDIGGSVSMGFQVRMEFVKSVGSHQTITNRGLVRIDEPSQFSAKITLDAPKPSELPFGTPLAAEIDLMGLARADSYTFKNDMLRLYSGKKVIDTLKLHDSTQFGLEVENTTSGVSILAYTDAMHTKVGSALPAHQTGGGHDFG
jgi:hypothetical protein